MRNWLKQWIASAVSFFSGYKLLQHFYPQCAAKLLLGAASVATFMGGITAKSNSAMTWMLGSTLAASAYLVPGAGKLAEGQKWLSTGTTKEYAEKLEKVGITHKSVKKAGSHLRGHSNKYGNAWTPVGGSDGDSDDDDSESESDDDDSKNKNDSKNKKPDSD